LEPDLFREPVSQIEQFKKQAQPKKHNTMKRLLSLAFTLATCVSALAQGTLNFANFFSGNTTNPIYDTDGTTRLGAGFIAGLYAGTVGTAWDSLTAVAPTAAFPSAAGPGFFLGGSHVVPSVNTGSPAAIQVRVWNAAFATWDAAWAAYQAGDPTAKVGVNGWNGTGLPTTTFTTPNLGGGAVSPANLVGLTSFQLYAVPEPSTIALGVLGIGALLLRRRK
jgi:hypothetical protein